MRDDNKGFSLIELIVVIAIMAILLGTMAANIGRISGYRAKECRNKVISSLENGRMTALSKSRGGSYIDATKTYLVFVKNNTNGCNYCLTVVEGQVTDVKKVSKGNVTLKFSYTKDAADGTEVGAFDGPQTFGLDSASDQINAALAAGTKVAYNRQNGAFLPYDAAGTTYIYQMFATLGKYNYGITLHPKTGKVEVGERTKVPTS
jgi:prepilin-type N-terminal cleavage/methylation domain-containing protein